MNQGKGTYGIKQPLKGGMLWPGPGSSSGLKSGLSSGMMGFKAGALSSATKRVAHSSMMNSQGQRSLSAAAYKGAGVARHQRAQGSSMNYLHPDKRSQPQTRKFKSQGPPAQMSPSVKEPFRSSAQRQASGGRGGPLTEQISPEELTYCDLCHSHFLTAKTYLQHRNSTSHKVKETRLTGEPKRLYLLQHLNKVKKLAGVQVHLKIAGILGETRNIGGVKQFYCMLCDVWCSGLKLWYRHKNLPAHQKKLHVSENMMYFSKVEEVLMEAEDEAVGEQRTSADQRRGARGSATISQAAMDFAGVSDIYATTQQLDEDEYGGGEAAVMEEYGMEDGDVWGDDDYGVPDLSVGEIVEEEEPMFPNSRENSGRSNILRNSQAKGQHARREMDGRKRQAVQGSQRGRKDTQQQRATSLSGAGGRQSQTPAYQEDRDTRGFGRGGSDGRGIGNRSQNQGHGTATFRREDARSPRQGNSYYAHQDISRHSDARPSHGQAGSGNNERQEREVFEQGAKQGQAHHSSRDGRRGEDSRDATSSRGRNDYFGQGSSKNDGSLRGGRNDDSLRRDQGDRSSRDNIFVQSGSKRDGNFNHGKRHNNPQREGDVVQQRGRDDRVQRGGDHLSQGNRDPSPHRQGSRGYGSSAGQGFPGNNIPLDRDTHGSQDNFIPRGGDSYVFQGDRDDRGYSGRRDNASELGRAGFSHEPGLGPPGGGQRDLKRKFSPATPDTHAGRSHQKWPRRDAEVDVGGAPGNLAGPDYLQITSNIIRDALMEVQQRIDQGLANPGLNVLSDNDRRMVEDIAKRLGIHDFSVVIFALEAMSQLEPGAASRVRELLEKDRGGEVSDGVRRFYQQVAPRAAPDAARPPATPMQMEGSALGPADYVDPELMQVASKVLRDAMFEFKSRKAQGLTNPGLNVLSANDRRMVEGLKKTLGIQEYSVVIFVLEAITKLELAAAMRVRELLETDPRGQVSATVNGLYQQLERATREPDVARTRPVHGGGPILFPKDRILREMAAGNIDALSNVEPWVIMAVLTKKFNKLAKVDKDLVWALNQVHPNALRLAWERYRKPTSNFQPSHQNKGGNQPINPLPRPTDFNREERQGPDIEAKLRKLREGNIQTLMTIEPWLLRMVVSGERKVDVLEQGADETLAHVLFGLPRKFLNCALGMLRIKAGTKFSKLSTKDKSLCDIMLGKEGALEMVEPWVLKAIISKDEEKIQKMKVDHELVIALKAGTLRDLVRAVEGTAGNERVCFKCRKPGHTARECTNKAWCEACQDWTGHCQWEKVCPKFGKNKFTAYQHAEPKTSPKESRHHNKEENEERRSSSKDHKRDDKRSADREKHRSSSKSYRKMDSETKQKSGWKDDKKSVVSGDKLKGDRKDDKEYRDKGRARSKDAKTPVRGGNHTSSSKHDKKSVSDNKSKWKSDSKERSSSKQSRVSSVKDSDRAGGKDVSSGTGWKMTGMTESDQNNEEDEECADGDEAIFEQGSGWMVVDVAQEDEESDSNENLGTGWVTNLPQDAASEAKNKAHVEEEGKTDKSVSSTEKTEKRGGDSINENKNEIEEELEFDWSSEWTVVDDVDEEN